MEKKIVVLTTVPDSKPRAGVFAGEAIEAAVSAANVQGLAVVVPTTDELVALAGDIPAGRVTSAGKVSCSFVKQDLYDRFASLIGTEHELRPLDLGSEEQRPAELIAAPRWSGITAGSVVLATVGREDGWWEAVVLGEDPSGERLTLSWRDWPKLPSFTAARRSVALTSAST